MIEDIRKEPAMPVYFGKNQSGMQAKEELSEKDIETVKEIWLNAAENAIRSAEAMVAVGLHKQIANRVLEPWFHMRTIVTATEWDNFYALRRHPDAQPEFKALADAMWEAKSNNVPQLKFNGEWHLPFVKPEESTMDLEILKKISVARCCRISYLNLDGSSSSVEKDISLHDSLLQSGHMSPFEHAAMLVNDGQFYGNFRTWKQYRKEFSNEENFAKLSAK
jgi:thymidylate synthase ThyX